METKQPSKLLKISEEGPPPLIQEQPAPKLVNIYNESWINQVLDSKKTWQEKRDLLEDFLENLPNIQKRHFDSIISQLNIMLKRLLNDSNITIVLLSIKIIEKMYILFNKEAGNYAKGLLQLLVEKFKDKKSNVVEETHKALEALRKNLNLEENSLRAYFSDLLDSKNTNQRLNILIFLGKSVNTTNFESIFPLIRKGIEDQSQEIRDLAMEKVKEFCVIFGEKRIKPMVLDLPTSKIQQILPNEESSTNSPGMQTSKIEEIPEKEPKRKEENPLIQGFIEKFRKKTTTVAEIFVIQELDFLRMSKKMRVFQAESKKINENDQKACLDLMKIQFTQVFTKNIREKILDSTEKTVFLEVLVEINESMLYYLEGTFEGINEGLMKYESVTDLLIRYFSLIFRTFLSKSDDALSRDCLDYILKVFQSLINIVSHLKQIFLEFEVKSLMNLSIQAFSAPISDHFEEAVFKLLETLICLMPNSNKMTEFYLEEFRYSDPKHWKFRDLIVRLMSRVLIPKLSHFPLNLLPDFWEIISSRQVITSYRSKFPEYRNFPNYPLIFFDFLVIPSHSDHQTSEQLISNKTFVLETSMRPEWLVLCLETLRNSRNLTGKIDALLFLNDMATSETKENHNLFHEKTEEILITFLITLRDLLLDNCVNTQFPNYFLNFMQKFIASGLLNLQSQGFLMLAEEILFALVRNQNTNMAKLLNLCLRRILEFGEAKLIMLGFWKLLIKYSKFPCYYLIFQLVNLGILKIMAKIKIYEDLPIFELFTVINMFVKQYKKASSPEYSAVKTVKCVIYQLIQGKGVEVLKVLEKINDLSDVFMRWVNAISRPFFQGNSIRSTSSTEEIAQYIVQIKEYSQRIRDFSPEFDEVLMKLVEMCEFGFEKEVSESISDIENENLRSYVRLCLERLLFIRRFPFIAQENKIFHRKIEKKLVSTNNLPLIPERRAYDPRCHLMRAFQEAKKMKDGLLNMNKSTENRNSENNNQNPVSANLNNLNNNDNTTSNLFKLDEKTEENLIYMLQRSEDYIEHPGLEDLCNPFTSKELIEEENLINFDESFCSFTYCDDNLMNINEEKEKSKMKENETEKKSEEAKGNEEINEGCLEEIESVVSEDCDGKVIKLTEIPENEELEESRKEEKEAKEASENHN